MKLQKTQFFLILEFIWLVIFVHEKYEKKKKERETMFAVIFVITSALP